MWKILSEVKTLFARFSEELQLTHRRIEQATCSVDDVLKRTEAMGRKLRDVEILDTHVLEKIQNNRKITHNFAKYWTVNA